MDTLGKTKIQVHMTFTKIYLNEVLQQFLNICCVIQTTLILIVYRKLYYLLIVILIIL